MCSITINRRTSFSSYHRTDLKKLSKRHHYVFTHKQLLRTFLCYTQNDHDQYFFLLLQEEIVSAVNVLLQSVKFTPSILWIRSLKMWLLIYRHIHEITAVNDDGSRNPKDSMSTYTTNFYFKNANTLQVRRTITLGNSKENLFPQKYKNYSEEFIQGVNKNVNTYQHI